MIVSWNLLSCMVRTLAALLVFAVLGPSVFAQAGGEEFVDFEQFTEPSMFDGVKPPVTVGSATFSGGQLLTATSALPANRTTVYGTTDFIPGFQPELKIMFAEPVSEISFQVINGRTTPDTLIATDDQGGMTQATVPPNFLSGQAILALPSAGVQEVIIRGSQGSRWNFYIDDIRFTTGVLEFDVSFSAFIPANNVIGGPSEFCFGTIIIDPPFLDPIEVPGPRQLYFKGDDRNFNPPIASSRTRQSVTVIATESADADGLKEGTLDQFVGMTRSYASDAIENNGTIDFLDEDEIADDCVLFHQAGQALATGTMFLTVTRLDTNSVEVKMDGGPGNPLSAVAQRFGTLDWDFTLNIDTSGGSPQWTLVGKHDGFPAYEIYINDTNIYQYDPGPQPYEFTTQVRRLLGGLDVDVGNRSGTLP